MARMTGLHQRKHLLFAVLSAFMILVNSGCESPQKRYHAAPGSLPFTERVMKSAGFWIHRHPSPDKVILSPAEIKLLNGHIENDLHLTRSIATLQNPYPGQTLRRRMNAALRQLRRKTLFHQNGSAVEEIFYERMAQSMCAAEINEAVHLRYGFIARYSDQRIVPTKEPLYAARGDFDFDELQNSALDTGTPVAVVHENRDGKWLYVIDRQSEGWIEGKNVALCSRDDLDVYCENELFVVITESKSDLYLDGAMNHFYDVVRTGVRLPLADFDGKAGNVCAVIIPLRDGNGRAEFTKAYLHGRDIHVGYVPFTARSMIEQAFQLLDAPYGWGGMHGERDCSRFIEEIFAVAGILLPRNSSQQALAATRIRSFSYNDSADSKAREILRTAVGGNSLLCLKGHIMLYIGAINGRPYVIHNTWGYREPTWNGDRVRVINKVAVTDLSLGSGSRKGSYLDRILSLGTFESSLENCRGEHK